MKKRLLASLLAVSLLAVPVMAEEETETEEISTEAVEAETELVSEAEPTEEEEPNPEAVFFGTWNLYQIDKNGECISGDSTSNGRITMCYGMLDSQGAIRGEGTYNIYDNELVVTIDDNEFTATYEFFHEDLPHDADSYNEGTANVNADAKYNRVKVTYNEIYTDKSDPLAPKKVENEFVYYFEKTWRYFFNGAFKDMLDGRGYDLESGASVEFYISDGTLCVDMSFDGEPMQEGVTAFVVGHELSINWEQGNVTYVIDEIGPEGFTAHNKKDEESILVFSYTGEAENTEAEETDLTEAEEQTTAE